MVAADRLMVVDATLLDLLGNTSKSWTPRRDGFMSQLVREFRRHRAR